MNPFVTKGYAGADYFCDREKETLNLTELVLNGNDLALISPRRLGKTELICHCFAQPTIRDHFDTFLVDIYSTSSLRDFVNVFGQAILDELKPKGRKFWEVFLSSLKSIQAQFSFDFNGNPVWGLGLGKIDNPELTLREIFHYLAHAPRPCLVAIDEFQQIMKYPESNVEAALRTYIQHTTNTTFIFSGSKRHMMNEIFTSPSRPFYQSVITMGLSPIPLDKYVAFARRLFEDEGKSIGEDVVTAVYRRFRGVTSYMQRVMNVLFMRTHTGTTATLPMAVESVNYILDLLSENYETQYSQMTERQRLMISVIAHEGTAANITGGAFIKKYHLWSPSSVMSAVKGLMEKDYVTHERNGYLVYDEFFALWLLRNAGQVLTL